MTKIAKNSMIFCVIFLLLFSWSLGVAAADISVTATVSNAGVIAVGADAEQDHAATVMAKVPVKLTGADSYTVNDVLKALHQRYYSGGSAGYATTANAGSVTKLWGVSTSNTLFFVNGVGLTTGVGTDTVADGDIVTASINRDQVYYADWYTGFQTETKTVAVKESFDLTLKGYLGMAYTEEDKASSAVAGVSIGVVDASGFTALTGKTTDAEGKVSLSFDKAGTYVISAAGTVSTKVTDWGQSGYPKVDFNAPIIAPVCVVKVEEPKVALTVTDNSEGTPEAGEYTYVPGDTPVELKVNPTVDFEGGTYKYQWRYKTDAEATDYKTAGSSSQIKNAVFKKIVTSSESIRYYYCHVTYTLNGEAYEFDSPLVKVSVIAKGAMTPSISSQPVGGISLAGSTDVKTLSVSASVSDGGKLSYQWYADSGSGYEAIDGATAKTYTPFSAQAGTITYYCLVKNSLDSISGISYSTGIKSETAAVEYRSAAAYGAAWEGKGTLEEPYLLSTQKDLTDLSALCNGGLSFAGMYFKMTGDITLPTEWTPIGAMAAGSEPAKPFSGIFDGDHHTLTVPENGLSLMGFVRGATVQNLDIFGTKIASNGLVAYYAVDSGVDRTVDIVNCTLKSGSSTLYSGFIGGYASGVNAVTFRNCTVEKNVVIGYDGTKSGIGSFGGEFNGYANGCVSYATVKGVNNVGGIIGVKGQSMGACDIHDCAFYGKVIATGEFAGGILGSGYTAASAPQTPCVSIRNSFAVGDVTGKNNVGGIFGGEGGVRETWNNGVGYIQNNYFAGTVTATDENGVCGGVIGYMRSLGRYNIISNNFYLNSCGADKGIGKAESVTTLLTPAITEGSGWTAVNLAAGTVYGRGDDPMGLGAKTLAASFTKESLTNGELLAKLNSGINSSGDWVQGSDRPTFGGKRHLLAITNSALSAMNGVNEAVGDSVVEGKELTLTYSDGSVETVDAGLAVRKYAATNNTMADTTVADALTYNNHQLIFKLNIKAGTDLVPPTPSENDITVSFTLLGDTVHGENGTAHTLKDGTLQTWIGKTDVTVPEGSNVMTVFAKALNEKGYSWMNDDEANSLTGNYIQSITTPVGVTLAEFTNGTNSGWMYTLNQKHPLFGVNEQKVINGDSIVFHYTDDYTEEEDLTADEIAANAVKTLIKKLPAEIVLSDETAIVGARAAYDALTEAQKNLILSTELSKLTEAEADLALLKAAEEDKAAAKAVTDTILALSENPSLNDKTAVAAARKDYEDLSKGQKALISAETLARLTTAEAAIEKLEAQTPDRVAADKVIALIYALPGEVTTAEEGGIAAAREAYDGLTDAQKDLVSSRVLNKLLDSEKALDAAKAAAQKQAADKAAAAVVDELIHDIGNVTEDSKAAIDAAGNAYEALSEEQKAFVTAYDTLLAAEAAYNELPRTAPFSDTNGHWGSEAIGYVFQHALMSGVGDSRFAPNENLTRGMLVAILYRAAGNPAVEGECSFTDVPADQYYYFAVLWASKNSIVAGTTETTFEPNADITREQLAVMIYRYAAYEGYDMTRTYDLTSFSDNTEISSWAKDAMGWTCATGLITGRTSTTLVPQGTATRAEVASILMRFMKNVSK